MRAILTAAILCSVFQVLPGMVGSAAAQHYDCAHGPDYYRVRNVASHDHLNVRARPSSRSVRVGAIPYNGIRIKCIGPCKGRWCKVDWSGTVGWVNMRFLGE
ncbi:MAG: SH3 domain-containing protein [Hyphomicrobiaceae bacterium TMED74]|nr:hypothetical protein [Filomicrobium sp.]RPG45152.1 MAG: SH3 domain-containing protein [Hyphomicrobiaceae bacterium TMED74]